MKTSRHMTASYWWLLPILLFSTSPGCADNQTPTEPVSVENTDRTPVAVGASDKVGSSAVPKTARLEDVVASWESGNKDEAVRQFLLIRWDEPAAVSGLPVLDLSEEQFASLPADRKISVQDESIRQVTTFKSLARHAITAGDNARASGQTETATAHYEAVRHLGEALSSPARLLIIQQLGKAIVKSVSEIRNRPG
jgi:hypothetical protein